MLLQIVEPATYECDSNHYSDIIMDAVASQITSLTIVYSTDYLGANQRKHQSSMSHWPTWGKFNIDQWPRYCTKAVTWKMFPFDDIIMKPTSYLTKLSHMRKLMDMVLVKAMAADALVLVFHREQFQLPATFQCWEMIAKKQTYVCVSAC